MPVVAALLEFQLAILAANAHAHQGSQRKKLLGFGRRLNRASLNAGIEDQQVALVQTLGHMPQLIDRIETSQRISAQEKEARRFTHIGRQQQMDGAGYVRLDAEGFAIVVLGRCAGHFEHGLAGIHRVVLDVAARNAFSRAPSLEPSPAPKLMTGTRSPKAFVKSPALEASVSQVSRKLSLVMADSAFQACTENGVQ
jgi:hypothetical protein